MKTKIFLTVFAGMLLMGGPVYGTPFNPLIAEWVLGSDPPVPGGIDACANSFIPCNITANGSLNAKLEWGGGTPSSLEWMPIPFDSTMPAPNSTKIHIGDIRFTNTIFFAPAMDQLLLGLQFGIPAQNQTNIDLNFLEINTPPPAMSIAAGFVQNCPGSAPNAVCATSAETIRVGTSMKTVPDPGMGNPIFDLEVLATVQDLDVLPLPLAGALSLSPLTVGETLRFNITDISLGELSEVPEPSTILLFGTGLIGLIAYRLRRGRFD